MSTGDKTVRQRILDLLESAEKPMNGLVAEL